jgi:hypothetical protein
MGAQSLPRSLCLAAQALNRCCGLSCVTCVAKALRTLPRRSLLSRGLGCGATWQTTAGQRLTLVGVLYRLAPLCSTLTKAEHAALTAFLELIDTWHAAPPPGPAPTLHTADGAQGPSHTRNRSRRCRLRQWEHPARDLASAIGS